MQLPFSEDELVELVRREGESSRFISAPTLYYLKAYKRVSRGSILFNFPAFFFGFLWFFYRKMYLFGFLAFLLAPTFPFGNIVLGFCANYAYFHFLREAYLDGQRHIGAHSKWLVFLLALCTSAAFWIFAGLFAFGCFAFVKVFYHWIGIAHHTVLTRFS